AVIEACARAYRPGQRDTWITESFKRAYGELAQAGVVHSVEVYVSGALAGGLWGTAVGATFTGESMFHTRTDCSKIAFAALNAVCKAIGIRLIDCQAESDHIVSLGARPIPRGEYTEQALANAREPMAGWERVRNRPVNVLLKQLAAPRA
ncbi:MAG: hypothetical protein HUK26_09735, partial [Duodenibacillus sp.]|nr:hypothetical protein [Duodenibacillus sp.]